MDFPAIDAFRTMPTGLEGASSVRDVQSEMSKPAMTVTGPPSVASAEAADSVPDDALRRDDALGELISGAFDMAAAPAPDFVKMGA